MAAPPDFGFIPDPVTPAALVPQGDPDFGFIPDAQPKGGGAGGNWDPEPADSALVKAGKILNSARNISAGAINMAGTTLGAAGGAVGGAFFGGPVGAVAGGSLGAAGGNAGAQKLNQALGFQNDFSKGSVAAAAIGGMVPGGSLAEAGVGQFAAAAAKNVAANTAAVTAQTLIDEQRAPTGSEYGLAALSAVMAPAMSKLVDSGTMPLPEKAAIQQLRNSLSDQSLAAAQVDGYKFPATLVNPGSAVAQAVEGTAGKADVRRAFNEANQQNTNEIAKDDMGMPPNVPIGAKSFDQAKAPALATYGAIAASSPEASDLLKIIQQTRDAATSAWQDANNPNATNRTVLRQYAATKASEVQQWEGELQKNLAQTGNADLFSQYQAARTQLAKVATYKNVWNRATGDISASDLGAQYDDGKPFTGGLAKIGNANLVLSKFTQDGADQLAIGGGKLSGAEGATVGALVGGVPGAIAGKVIGMAGGSKISEAARKFALSDDYQSVFAKRDYGTPPPEFAARLAQQGTLASGRPNTTPTGSTLGIAPLMAKFGITPAPNPVPNADPDEEMMPLSPAEQQRLLELQLQSK